MNLVNATFLLGSSYRKFARSSRIPSKMGLSTLLQLIHTDFAVASSSLQELQKFAYKFNAQFFHTTTAI